SISTPRARRQRAVLATSAPVDRPLTRASLSATALRITARCEIDLSPGRLTSPCNRRGARTAALNPSSPTRPAPNARAPDGPPRTARPAGHLVPPHGAAIGPVRPRRCAWRQRCALRWLRRWRRRAQGPRRLGG